MILDNFFVKFIINQYKGILFDLPYAIEAAKGKFANNPLLPRMNLEAGDFFESVP